MTTSLIDADIVCYRCAAASENDSVDVAIMRADDLMRRILHETASDNYFCYLTGSNNFRYKYNPEYKANRKDTPRPQYLQAVREHLVVNWHASVEDEQEADDAMGIEQMAMRDTIICSIDKDLLMIPGEHYNFVTGVRQDISPLQGIRHFYWQLIMGDRTDNIFGFDGKARHKVPKFLESNIAMLQNFDDERDMYDYVLGMYENDEERMLINGICLWIRRNPDELWGPPA